MVNYSICRTENIKNVMQKAVYKYLVTGKRNSVLISDKGNGNKKKTFRGRKR